MKKIKLTQGKYALVDNIDFEWLNQWKWYANKRGNHWYAQRNNCGYVIQMHREILGLQKGDGKITDHVNCNSLNNRRCNLRLATKSENGFNRGIKTRGVCFYISIKKWRAVIWKNFQRIHLGYFKKKRDAIKARREAEIKYFGEFAHGYKIQRTGT